MTYKVNKVIESAYKTFSPSESERESLQKTADFVMSELDKRARKKKINVELHLGGSFSRGTWIKGTSDIDVFVVFPAEEGTKLLRKLVPNGYTEEHGTRTYFVGNEKGVRVEIIPMVKVTNIEKVENSVDFSVLHYNYVNRKMNPRLVMDAILMKQFCKSAGCYGSETFIHGFSGYSLELLIINYGGFLSLLEAVSHWKPPVFIDLEHRYGGLEEAKREVGANTNPLILVDPVNSKRNVCGSLSVDKFASLLLHTKQFILNPSMSFFTVGDKKKTIIATSKLRGSKIFRSKTRIIKPVDSFMSRYTSRLNALCEDLGRNGISIYSNNFVLSDGYVEAFIEVSAVPQTDMYMAMGPKAWIDVEDFNKFAEEHKRLYIAGDTIAYDKTYSFSNPNKFILKKIEEYITDKALMKS
jgi:tRNA nucleotidyltransferase (CCA-adding enzyme)